MKQTPRHIVHVVYSFHYGGLENGVVNIINHLPREQFKHTLVCIADYSDFVRRIERDDVEIIALRKQPGHDFALYWRLYKLFRQLRPDVVHTRNIGAIEAQIPAWLAGVKYRIHSEHGRDEHDLDGKNWKYTWLRRVLGKLAHRVLAMSKDLQTWLAEHIGIARGKLVQIYNGVNLDTFQSHGHKQSHADMPFAADDVVFVTVGRMQPVKDQLTLARAFVELCQRQPQGHALPRLAMIGHGPLYEQVEKIINEAGLQDYVWLPGGRTDVAEVLAACDVFVLPSLNEGISNTILEAMACRLPVIATAVGGNVELVDDGHTGLLVPAENLAAMADAMQCYWQNEGLRLEHAGAARAKIEQQFSLPVMIRQYQELYQAG